MTTTVKDLVKVQLYSDGDVIIHILKTALDKLGKSELEICNSAVDFDHSLLGDYLDCDWGYESGLDPDYRSLTADRREGGINIEDAKKVKNYLTRILEASLDFGTSKRDYDKPKEFVV